MRGGSIHFEVTASNEDLKRKLAESRQAILNSGKAAEAQAAKIEGMFKRASMAIGAAVSIGAIKQFGADLINIRGQFQTFEAILSNTLQSPTKAKDAMNMLQEFAATTPFQVDALTGAFVKLANQGFTPTYDEMTKLGDLASSTGKGFDQLTEAIIDAQTGEFERLKEFGIRANKEGDKVTFTFKEQATQVDFTASSIRDYVLSLGDMEGVMGANAKIAKTLTGQVSNLQDGITQMMNEVGESSEGALSGAISGASYLVENYEKVGRVLGSLILTYGTYKASLITTNAIQRVSTSVHYATEIAELTKLLPLKKADANADITLALAKGRLTQATADQLVAKRAEVATELESLKIKTHKLATEAVEAANAHKDALRRSVVAKQNMALAQSQMQIAIQGGNADEIADAKKAAQSAKIEMNSAAIAKNTTQQALGAAQSKSAAAATAVNTMQTNINAAATNGATTAKNLFSAATIRLKNAFNSLKLAFASNPIGLVLTAVTLVTTAMSLFGDKLNKAENAQQRLNNAMKRSSEEINTEKAKVESLLALVNNENLSRDIRTKKLEELIALSPEYLKTLTLDTIGTTRGKDAIDEYIESITKKIKLQQLEKELADSMNRQAAAEDRMKNPTGWDTAMAAVNGTISNVNFLRTTFMKGVVPNIALELSFPVFEIKNEEKIQKDIKNKMNEIAEGAISAKPIAIKASDLSRDIELLHTKLNEITELKNKLTKNKTEPSLLSSYDAQIEKLTKDQAKPWLMFSYDTQIKALEKLIDAKNAGSAAISNSLPVIYGIDYESAKKEWQLAKKELDKIEKDKSAYTSKQYDEAKKRAETAKTSFEYLGGITLAKDSKKDIEESARQQEEVQKAADDLKALLITLKHDTTQAVIDADEDGAWRELAQIELNYEKKIAAIERWEKEQRNRVIEAQKKKYIAEHGSDKGFMVNESAPAFTDIKSSVEAQTALNVKTKTDAIAAQSKSEQDAMNDYLSKWGDMEQKRAAITADYDEKIRNAKTKGEKLSLEKEKDKSISDLRVDNLLASDDAQTLFGNLDNISSKTIQSIATSLKSKAQEQLKDGTLGGKAYIDMLKRIGEAEQKAQSNNPFSTLIKSAKGAFKQIDETDKQAVADRKQSWKEMGVSMGQSLDIAAQAMGEVGNIADALGASEETQATISQVTGMLSGAGDIAKGLATGDISSVIKGVGGMITSMIDLFDFRSKRANKIIKEEGKNIEELGKKYKDLERTIADTLGSDYYKKQIEQTKNLQEQQRSLDKMIDAENSKRKRKRDAGKIDEWNEQKKDLAQQAKEIRQTVINELSTTDLKSYSSDLSSSLIDGLSQGLDNANEVLDEKMDALLKNMIAKQFDMLVAQERMKPMFDAMASAFGENSEGGFDLTTDELANIVQKGNEGKAGIIDSLSGYEKILNEFGLINDEITGKANSAAGAISAQLTEQTGSEMLGMIRLQTDCSIQIRDINYNQFEFMKTGWSQIADIARSNLEIAANTFRTANNTDGLASSFEQVNNKLEKIERNTAKTYSK